jgi:hypothetical protein
MTTDLDGTFERLEAGGAEVAVEPIIGPDGALTCAFLDPAGNLLRIERAKQAVRSGDPEPRPLAQRRREVERRLGSAVDLWVATASPEGHGHLVPLSFVWDGEALLMTTSADSPTGRNLIAAGVVRLALGDTRDVIMVDGWVEVFDLEGLPPERIERFVTRTGFDPRTTAGGYRWFRVTPRRIQAWRQVNELPGRELMRDGRWLTA